MEKGLRLTKNTGPTVHSILINGVVISYTSLVGSLMYVMLGTFPDLAFPVGVLG